VMPQGGWMGVIGWYLRVYTCLHWSRFRC
jgi:hypothetical protein